MAGDLRVGGAERAGWAGGDARTTASAGGLLRQRGPPSSPMPRSSVAAGGQGRFVHNRVEKRAHAHRFLNKEYQVRRFLILLAFPLVLSASVLAPSAWGRLTSLHRHPHHHDDLDRDLGHVQGGRAGQRGHVGQLHVERNVRRRRRLLHQERASPLGDQQGGAGDAGNSQSFPVRNGQTTGTITLEAPSGSLQCPPGQHVELIDGTFSSVTLIGPGGLTYAFPDQTITRA